MPKLLVPLLVAAAASIPTTHARLQFVGHRGGMSGHNTFVPEHSKAAYALGASNGVNLIEPDVISSKDGVLYVMHRNELSRTSDISEKAEFADRKTTKVIDDGDGSGKSTLTGWFSEDFTWEEISTLRLRSTLYDGDGPLDGIYSFLKFEEMMVYVQTLSGMVNADTPFGIYPETKLSNYFSSINLPLEEKFMDAIANAGYCGYEENGTICKAELGDDSLGPILLQSFCPESLQTLRTMTNLPTVCLINGGSAGELKISTDKKTVDPEMVAEIATYSDMLSLPTSFDSNFFAAATKAGKDAGMTIHAWYVDDDPELYTFLTDLGVAATFTNNMAYSHGAADMIDFLQDSGRLGDGDSQEKLSKGKTNFTNSIVLPAALFAVVAMAGVTFWSHRRQNQPGQGKRDFSELGDEIDDEDVRLSWNSNDC
ncbi:hypothetical protein TL16_g05583 [Triparma laevis f. inornata]|uniref:glycerophosphodiester phosphodiesterase n=1 Tax=Triparma laevis f. inornata TaxID=1714386 RepID=A0A9W7AIG3_9STRA|nr:hypothetical protein TL16_g05583 [Triparma laevis f. inornata]